MKSYHVTVDDDNTIMWYDKPDGKLHREDGPAVESANGRKDWYLNGKRHREDGPAIEWADGYKAWWLNGKLHREDGPAVEDADGYKAWWLNGKHHREDGPAVEYANGYKAWWLNGKELTEKEFLARTQKSTCEGKVIEIEGKKYKLTALPSQT